MKNKEKKKGKAKGSRQTHMLNKNPFSSQSNSRDPLCTCFWSLLGEISLFGGGALFPFLRSWGKAPSSSQEAKVQRVLLETTPDIHYSHLRLMRRDLNRPKSSRGHGTQGIKCTIPLTHANKHIGEERCTALSRMSLCGTAKL